MQSNGNYTNEPSFKQAIKLAQSKEGRQLYELLQTTQPDMVNCAMENAASGNYEQVKSAMSSLLAKPEVQELLRKLGEK